MSDTFTARHQSHCPCRRTGSAAQRRRPSRVTHAERLALLVILALLLVGAWVTAAPPSTTMQTRYVLAAPGDTLWALASEHPAPGLTTQQNADMIARLNHLTNGTVSAGRLLRVPARPTNALAMR